MRDNGNEYSTSISEIVPELSRQAARRLHRSGFDNIKVWKSVTVIIDGKSMLLLML